jgi:ATP-dependent Lon protease
MYETSSETDYEPNETDYEASESGTETGTESESEGYESNTVQLLKGIYTGDFFYKRPLIEKKVLTKEFLDTLVVIQKEHVNAIPEIYDIVLHKCATINEKKIALENLYILSTSEIGSNDYYKTLKFFKTFGKEKENILDTLKTSDTNKSLIQSRIDTMRSLNDSDSEYNKYKTWVDSILKVPFGVFASNTAINLSHVRRALDKKISFLDKPKDQIINMFAKMYKNPDATINALGIFGTKGTGKTSIVSSIADALQRPCRMISVGGESDASTLIGHHFTYIGAIYGRIAEILIETKCMDPVILIDEIDKIGDGNGGRELIGSLIHLTDTSTNHMYSNDRYFSGIQFDLSKVLFVFTYNDESKVDKILLDRLYKIRVKNYTTHEKLVIMKKHIIPKTLKEYRYLPSEIVFGDDVIRHIIKVCASEDGMRNLARRIDTIISRINTLILTHPDDGVVKLKYKKIYEKTQLPIHLTLDDVDVLLDQTGMEQERDTIPFQMYT